MLFLNFSKSNDCISHDILIKTVVSDKQNGAHIHALLSEWRTILLFPLPFPLPYDQGTIGQAKLIKQNCNVLISCCEDLCSGHQEERQTHDVESREICIHTPGVSSVETESELFREERAEGTCDSNLPIRKRLMQRVVK